MLTVLETLNAACNIKMLKKLQLVTKLISNVKWRCQF